MFFSGDPSTRRRVDLGGRTSKASDRKNLLEQTRVERNRRLCLRQQSTAALKIQEHYVIDLFWEVLKGFSPENRKKFLKFVTGCSRGPLLGFRYLEPLFCIQRASGNASEESLDRLPTSATCMNLLKLPPYTSKEQLETTLLYAINADAGFDLS